MIHLDVIAGARPNFIKIASILRVLQGRLNYRLVHTGQHYDAAMSGDFFRQLAIPLPQVNLGVGSGSQAEQTAAIMIGYERVLRQEPSQLCLVVGDVNSTMACAITAQKMGVAVAHVEAGLRSGDWSMPEEINRRVTDAVSNLFFTTSQTANDHLRHMGVAEEAIHFVGNTMIDTLLANLDRLRPPDFWHTLGLQEKRYFVLTLHRPANVDERNNLLALLQAVAVATRGWPVIFPVHPRTARQVLDEPIPLNTIILTPPQPYLEFNYLVKHAALVLTDSGGIPEETTVLGVPCVTLRENTERPETVTMGTNELIGCQPANIQPALDRFFAGQWKQGGIPPLWDGQSGTRIVAVLEKRFLAGGLS